MSDTAAKTLRKVPELPKNRGKASEVLAAEPKTSLRQLAADNIDKKTLKNISGILDKFVSYSSTPEDRTTDITIRTVQEETAEALETTSLIINLSTKHFDEQNKTLDDILKLLRIRSKKESDATGGGSILGSLLDLLDYDGGKKAQKQRRYSSKREKKARQRLRQMRRQRMIRKLTRPFQRPIAPTIKPSVTSVTKPPVTPARPTVPQVAKTPVTPVVPATQVAKPPVTPAVPARPTVPQVPAVIASSPSVEPSRIPMVTQSTKPSSVISSITEKIKNLKPSLSNIVSGATSIGKGVATGVATDVALSSLTGRDEGLSSLALGFVPAAAGTVIATAGIKQAFTAAEALTPEERKGVDVRPETLDKILKNKLNIEVVNEKELEPFKAGQVVSAQTIAKEYDITSTEELKATIESLLKSGSGKNIKAKITTEKESNARSLEQTIPAEATPSTVQQSSTPQVSATPAIPAAQSESIDRNKLIDRLQIVSSKITDKDEKTVNRLENITMMIQNNQLNEASEAIERMEKRLTSATEIPLSDAFRERQNTPQVVPDAQRQRRSSLTDGSYQVASAQTTMTDATYVTDEPEVKLASDVKEVGEKIVDPTKTTTKIINETVNDINDRQITKATNTVEKLTSEVKEQNKLYETLNDVMSLLGFKRDVAKQTEQSKDVEEDIPEITPQAQATQNIQQLQAQVAQAPVSSGFSSGFSRMAGLAVGALGASAAAATVGRSSRSGTSGVNRIAAGTLGTVGGAAVMGAMMQPQNLGAFGSILSGGAAGAGVGQAITPQGRPSIAGTDGAAANITGDDASVMAMIKEHEGYKTKPYKDSRGFWTVGVGHLIGANLPPEMNREFTMQEIDQLFAKDYAEHKQAAMRIPGFEKLNPSGQAAVIDLTFNMGPAWYKKFPAASAALAKGDMETFANEMQNSAWFKQVGRRGPKIVAMLRGGGGQGGTMQASQQTTPGAQIASASTSMEAADQAQMRGAGQALKSTTAPAPSAGPQGIQMPMAATGMGEIPINIRLRQLQS